MMTDLRASHPVVTPGHRRPAWRRRFVAALPGLLYSALVLALFGGIAIDHLPESPTLQLGLVGGGAVLLLLAALWLDRREAQHDPAEPDAGGKGRALGTGD
ncbi:MAG TPA: hypothetical protein VMA53_19000 [Stellaceae bacterium]|nr:hypothetical protein [Stellaceae bacterium]